MEKRTLEGLGLIFTSGALILTAQILNKTRIDKLSEVTPQQALELRGKSFNSDRDGECQAGMFDPKKLGDVQYISCTKESNDGSKVYVGVVYGNSNNFKGIAEFRRLATTNGEIPFDHLNPGNLKFVIMRDYNLNKGKETKILINNCESNVAIASLGINTSNATFASSQRYQEIRRKTSTSKICTEIFAPESEG
jgi:hypothetical protein